MFSNIKANTPYDNSAGKLMEEYIESGSYKKRKELSLERDSIKRNIFDQLINHESKRHEIGYNLIAKFISRKVYKYDYVGLNEYLNDRGLLQVITKLSSNNLKRKDLLDLFKPYQLKSEFYIKPSLNKAGREIVKVEEPVDLQLSLDVAAKKKRENMILLRAVTADYQRLKLQMYKCDNIHKEEKVKHKYGSLSLLQKPLVYRVTEIADYQTIQRLIEFGKPNIEQLEYYMIKGFVSKSEVELFRELTDIKLEFVILDRDEEASMISSLLQKKNKYNY